MTDENTKKVNTDEVVIDSVDGSADDISIESDENLDDSVLAEDSAQESVKKLKEKLKIAIEEKQKYLDNWQRDKAEFMNARKRDSETQREMLKYANQSIVEELFPVLDSFNLAMGNKEAWEKVDKNWRIGVEYIFNQLKKVLEDNGVIEIDPIGKPFDPQRDEAIEYVPVDSADKDHIITSVIQKGYTLNGKSIKAPKVKVGEFKK